MYKLNDCRSEWSLCAVRFESEFWMQTSWTPQNGSEQSPGKPSARQAKPKLPIAVESANSI